MADEELLELWRRHWPLCRPVAHELKIAYRDRWVRFHGLPDSKRYPESASTTPCLVRRLHPPVLRPAPLATPAVDDLLRAVADDAMAGVMIAGPAFERIHHPYDGGADVLLSTTAERDALRERHARWLPTNPTKP